MAGSLEELYGIWSSGRANDRQRSELMRLLALPENKELALQLIRQAIETDNAPLTEGPALSADRLDLIFQSITIAGIPEERTATVPAPSLRKVVPYLRRAWIRYAAAAVLLLGLASISYLYLLQHSNKPVSALPTDIRSIRAGGDRAILTLSDGRTIVLDSASSGMLAQQGDVMITKTASGAIVYDAQGENDGTIMMNTMTTPRGGQYQLTLPDGTRVWLNAASSLRYPAVFSGDRRIVEMTGEAYFEVHKDKTKPFYVRINNQAEVEVTGTSFNINAYDDEPNMNTTLVEGSVNLWMRSGQEDAEDRNGQVTLAPGLQAKMAHPTSAGGHREAILVSKADIEKATAWKNGMFSFEGSTLKDAMRQLARWYDIEITYDEGLMKKGLQNTLLVGGIRRDLSLADALEILKALGLHFRMEPGRKLVLVP